MDENVRKLRVGIFVLMAMVILGILILVNSEGWVPQYIVYVKPERAPGVTVGTPVRKNGILIGRVKDVQTDDDQGLVLLTLGINQKNKVFENEICSIGTDSFLGDAKIEFLPLGVADRGSRVTDGSTVGTVAIEKNPMTIVSDFGDLKPQLQETLAQIGAAGESVKSAGEDVGKLTGTLQDAFQNDDSQFNQMIEEFRLTNKKAQLALDDFHDFFDGAKDWMGDEDLKAKFKENLVEIGKFVGDVRILVEDTKTAINKFGSIPDNVNDTLDNINVFSESLKDKGPGILEKVDLNLKNLDKFVSDLKGVGKTLERFKDADGTLVKLLQDDEIYEAIRETVKNINEVSVRLGPLMDDARLFADSIARDPGQLGVRGALDRRAPKTGYKGSAGLR